MIRRHLAASQPLRKAGVGFKARIEPIIYPEKIGAYAARYLFGAARYGRYWKDPRIRLWSASKNMRIANANAQMLTQWSRISRLKNAAYCALQGWRTMPDARDANPKWQYHGRPFLLGKMLRMYLHEADYVLEWGNRWSPKASGVRILYPQVRPSDGRIFRYIHNEQPTDPEELAELKRVWNAALEVPLEIWFGGDQ